MTLIHRTAGKPTAHGGRPQGLSKSDRQKTSVRRPATPWPSRRFPDYASLWSAKFSVHNSPHSPRL